MEQIEEVSDRRHVSWHVDVVAVLDRIGQVVPAARAQGGSELPVALDEFHERGVLIVSMADAPAGGERRDGDHGDARAGAEEVDRLDEAGVVIAAALVDGTKIAVSAQSASLLCASSTMFSANASKRLHFDEAGWPSMVPSGFT